MSFEKGFGRSGLAGRFKMGSATSAPLKDSIMDQFKRNMTTPGWQFIYKVVIFLLMIIVFGGIYQYQLSNNPSEWAHPKDKNGNSILNGFYLSSVVGSTVGYGDYYPYSARGIAIVLVNVMISWILFMSLLG